MKSNLSFIRKIKHFDYNDDTSVLTVYFNTSTIKRYSDVPKRIYESLLKSMDRNQFYQTVIDGSFCVE